MNRYPLWKYIIVAVALVLGFVYTLPNFFGESPAVQVSSAKATLKVDAEDAGQRRGSAESRRHRPQRHPARLQRRQDPLQ